jgi:hypothetical protein
MVWQGRTLMGYPDDATLRAFLAPEDHNET